MFIHYDQIEKTYALGTAAAPCLNCRSVRPHAVEELRRHHRLYFVPVGAGKPLATTARCAVCDRVFRADPAAFRAIVPAAEAADTEIEVLAERTNPNAAAELDRLLSFDERAASGELLPEDRIDLVVNALLSLEGRLSNRYKRTHLDVLSGGLVLLTIVLAIGLPILLTFPSPSSNMLGAIGLIIAVPVVAGTVWAVRTEPCRHIRRHHLGAMAVELQGFMPGTDEIAFAYERLKRMHVRCIEHLTHARLAAEVWAEPQPAPV